MWVQRLTSPSMLSDGTSEFDVYTGVYLRNVGGLIPTDGIYFRYEFATDGQFWAAVSSNGGVNTVTPDTNPIVADTIYELMIITETDWSAIRYYINGVLMATHSTNIPAATTDVAPRQSIRKGAGGGGPPVTSMFSVDYV